MNIEFSGFNCVIDIDTYTNGGTAIRLIDADDGMPVATASVWIRGLDEDEIAIKDYSENVGMLDTLVKSGIVTAPHREINGFPIVKLTEKK